jgi:hypothetical protein
MPTRDLVVDADVGTQAHDLKQHLPRCIACADALEAILAARHRVVFCEDLHGEWRNHAGKFGLHWLARMTGKRLIVAKGCPPDEHFFQRVHQAHTTQLPEDRLRKDFHLILLALSAEQRILSCDKPARRAFVSATKDVREIRPILWVDPSAHEEEGASWIASGAPNDSHRRLDRQAQ